MQKCNIKANLARANEQQYDKVICAVQMNGSTGEWVRTTAGVRHGLFSHQPPSTCFLERTMPYALEVLDGKVSIRHQMICELPMSLMLLLKKSRN